MYDNNLMILVPKKMKEQIKEKAENNFQTVSEYVRGLIIKDLNESK